MRSSLSRIGTTIVVGLRVGACTMATRPAPMPPTHRRRGKALVPPRRPSLSRAAIWAAIPALGGRGSCSARVSIVCAVLAAGLLTACAGPNAPTASGSLAPSSPSADAATPTPALSSASPGAASDAPASRAPDNDVARASLPVRDAGEAVQDIQLAATLDGGLYVSIAARAGTVLANLEPDGRARAGWPLMLAGWTYCTRPVPVADGSVRVVCARFDSSLSRAFAFDADGRLLAGWPVDFPGDIVDWAYREQPRVIGDRLAIVAHAYSDQTDPATGRQPGEAWLVEVTVDGKVSTGMRVAFTCCPNLSLSPAGVGYVTAYQSSAGEIAATEISAFGVDGVRAGWPARIDGIASAPAFGPDGRIHVVVGSPERSPIRTRILDQDGRVQPDGSDELPIASSSEWDGAGADYPGRPFLADDGLTYVIDERGGHVVNTGGGTTVFAVDSVGSVVPGWPYRAQMGLEYLGRCSTDPEETGCGLWRTSPAVAPGPILYLLHAAADPSSGGSILALDRGGRVVDGWPVGLRRPGATFASIIVGPDATIYAVAVEPEAGGRSGTILALEPDSTVRYRTTVVQP